MGISAIFRNSHELLNPYITFLKNWLVILKALQLLRPSCQQCWLTRPNTDFSRQSLVISLPIAWQELTGNKDVVFRGTFDIPIDGPGNCKRSSILAQTKQLYPRAKPYWWFSLDNSGLCWQLQYTA
jgi:hypothetical protein